MIQNKFFLFSLFFLPIICSAQSDMPVYTSPIVYNDRTVEFAIYAPDANKVEIKVTFQKDHVALTKNDSGLWTVKIGPLTPELYHYQFVVDGMVLSDNKNQNPYPWIEGKSELLIPGDPPLLHELTHVAHGAIHDHIYFSKTTSTSHSLRVYTPPGYNDIEEKYYPIIILLEGFASKVGFWTDFGKINLIVDNLIAQQKIVPPIMVIPDNSPVKADYHRFFTSKDEGNKWVVHNMNVFEKELFAEVFPFMKSQYKIKTDVESVAIIGSSMGGSQAVTIGLQNLDKIGWVAGLTASFPDPPFDITDKDKINQLKSFWLCIGKDNEWEYRHSKNVHEWLQENEIKHKWLVTEGGHEWDVWHKNMIAILPELFKEN